MLKENIPVEQIFKITKLSIEQIVKSTRLSIEEVNKLKEK